MYYQGRLVSEKDLVLMRIIDELHLEGRYADSRILRHLLGVRVYRRRVQP